MVDGDRHGSMFIVGALLVVQYSPEDCRTGRVRPSNETWRPVHVRVIEITGALNAVKPMLDQPRRKEAKNIQRSGERIGWLVGILQLVTAAAASEPITRPPRVIYGDTRRRRSLSALRLDASQAVRTKPPSSRSRRQ